MCRRRRHRLRRAIDIAWSVALVTRGEVSGRLLCRGTITSPCGSSHHRPHRDTKWNVAVAVCVLTWLDTASPTCTLDPMLTVALPMDAQLIPSADW
jgi:hypothetical protein